MKRLYTFLLLLLCCDLALAQNMPRVRQTIDTLTSETMHGRGYIFEGDAKAANYIRDRFAAAGLQHLPQSSNYFQTFTLPVNRVTETPLLKVDGKELKPGKEFVVQAASPTSIGQAKVLSLDTLIFSDAAAAQKFFSRDFARYALVYRQPETKRLREIPGEHQQKLQQAKVYIVLQKGLLTTVAQQQNQMPVLEVLESRWSANAKKIRYSIRAELVPAYLTQNVIDFVKGSIKSDYFLVFSAH